MLYCKKCGNELGPTIIVSWKSRDACKDSFVRACSVCRRLHWDDESAELINLQMYYNGKSVFCELGTINRKCE